MQSQTDSSWPVPAHQPMLFAELERRQVAVDFSAGHVSSDGGCLLLRQLDRGIGLSRKLAGCFLDFRDGRFVEHSLQELVSQRLIGLALGYEDLNDHDQLRRDPLLAVAANKADPLGMDRAEADRGKALASPSTLNRLELGNSKRSKAHKIRADHAEIETLLTAAGVNTLAKDSREVVIDLDATDNPLHGEQEGRFFHGYYGHYCYLPLYGFIGKVPVWAELRTSDGDACRGAVRALESIVAAVRRRCPRARVIVRGDGGFCREEIMAWCESRNPVVYYCFGLGRNPRLACALESAMCRARQEAILCGGKARIFSEFEYETLESWSRPRRVIGKAEVLGDKENPRFIVVNLPPRGFADEDPERFNPARCYEEFYCARGDMENRIKQQLLDLHADRASTHFMASNQLRLWLSTFAYLLVERLQAFALRGTELERATAGTVRLRLLKIGALVSVSVRRVHVRLAGAFPLKELFGLVHRRLMALEPEPG